MTNPIGNELIQVIGISNGGRAATKEYFTTQQIANLGGGGSTLTVQRMTTGTSATVSAVNTLFIMASSTSGAKNITIPSANSANKGQMLILKFDPNANGDAITFTPIAGTIDGSSNLTSTVKSQSWTLYSDGISNWSIT